MSRRRTTGLVLVALVLVLALVPWLLRPKPANDSPAPSASASAPRHPPFAAPGRVFPIGGEAQPVETSALGTLEGRVVSSVGDVPIAGAQITVVGPGPSHSIASDDGGAFVVRPAREGVHEIMFVTHPDYLPFASELGSSPVTFNAKKGVRITGITLRLVPATETTATVVDPDGKRVAGADIEIFDGDGAELSLKSLATRHRTDERGEARFTAPERAIVEARAPGFSPGRAELGFTARVARRLTITLRPKGEEARGGSIEGVVVEEKTGAPLGDVLVTAKREVDVPAATDAARFDPGANARTDASGRFQLVNLVTASTYALTASDGNHAPRTVLGVASNEKKAKITLEPGATLRGRVVDATTKAPIASVSVVVSERFGPLVVHPIRTATVFDADGHYAVDRLPKGTFLVTVAAEGYGPSPDREVTLAASGTTLLDFELKRGARLSGVVRDAATKAPIAGASVSLEGRWGGSEGAAALTPVAATDAAGRFTIVGLPPGKVSFLAGASGHHGRVFMVAIDPGSDPPAADIALTPTKPDEEPRIELVGIGAVLSAKGDELVIGKILPDGGAAEAGIRPGDAVLAIDGVPVTKLGFEAAIGNIRGPENTFVVLLVRRAEGGEPAPIRVPRRRVQS